MKRILSTIMMLYIFIAYGQTAIKKSCISTAGGGQISGTINLVYTVGELAIQERDIEGMHLSEGFISPGLIGTNGLEDFQILQNVKVFPNPVKTNLTVKFTDNHQYEIKLYDLNGREVYVGYGQDSVQIGMKELKRSVYILLIIDRKNKLFKNFKISKE